jgi:hypothetical protein
MPRFAQMYLDSSPARRHQRFRNFWNGSQTAANSIDQPATWVTNQTGDIGNTFASSLANALSGGPRSFNYPNARSQAE